MEVPIYFEDLVIGDSFVSDEVTVDNEEMLAYNRCNDPWPFHVDETSAAQNPGLAPQVPRARAIR